MPKGYLIVGKELYEKMDSAEKECVQNFINMGQLIHTGERTYVTGLVCLGWYIDHPDFTIGDDSPIRDELEYYLTLHKDFATGEATLVHLHCWYDGNHVVVKDYINNDL